SCDPSLRRLTNRVGRNTPAFIISISAVPPAIGRTVGSSGSSRPIASCRDVGSSNSKGVIIVGSLIRHAGVWPLRRNLGVVHPRAGPAGPPHFANKPFCEEDGLPGQARQ